MTNYFTRTLMLTAAILTLSAATVYGQESMTANIPFSFHANGATMPPGNYLIAPLAGAPGSLLTLRNLEAHKAIFPGLGARISSKDGTPRMVFYCKAGDCTLTQLWFDADRGWEYSRPRITDVEKERLATVYVHRSTGQ